MSKGRVERVRRLMGGKVEIGFHLEKADRTYYETLELSGEQARELAARIAEAAPA